MAFAAFDVLALAGREVMAEPWADRRKPLEDLSAAGLVAPQLHRQALDAGIKRGPPGDRSGQHHAPVLQADVVVEVARAVLFGRRTRAGDRPRAPWRTGRLGGHAEAALMIVLREVPEAAEVGKRSFPRRGRSPNSVTPEQLAPRPDHAGTQRRRRLREASEDPLE